MTIINEDRPYLKGFNAFYAREIEGWLHEQEQKRAAAIKRRNSWYVIAAAASAGVIAISFFFPAERTYFWVAAGIVGFGCFAMAQHQVSGLSAQVKQFLIGKIASFLNLDADPSASTFAFQRFRQLGILPSFDRHALSDQLTGTHDGVSLLMAEAKLEERRQQRTKTGTRTYYVRVFFGPLMRFSFPKTFHGQTVICKDHGQLFNWMGGVGRTGDRVALESPDFERHFQVYSTDQVEARYLLTPIFMERLLDMKAQLGNADVRAAFVDGHLYLSADTRENRFEVGSLSTPLADPDRISRILDDFRSVLDVIETLNLNSNTKI